MHDRRSRFLVPVIAASALGGLVTGAVVLPDASPVATAHAAAPKSDQTVVINLTHGTDDLHAVMMALELGRGLAERGADVSMFVNLEGVRLVDKNQPLSLSWGTADKKNIGQLYQSFIDAGGKVVVCPHCAEVAGLTKEDLRPGATLASEQAVVERMLAADKVIDY